MAKTEANGAAEEITPLAQNHERENEFEMKSVSNGDIEQHNQVKTRVDSQRGAGVSAQPQNKIQSGECNEYELSSENHVSRASSPDNYVTNDGTMLVASV